MDRLSATAIALSVAVPAAAVAIDWTPILVAAIAATPPSLMAFFGFRSSQAALRMAAIAADAASAAHDEAMAAHATSVATGKAVDGVKTELVEAVRGRAMSEGLATGRTEGKAIEKARAAEVQTALDTPSAHDASAVGVLVDAPQEPVEPTAKPHPRRLRRPRGTVDT